MRPRWEKITDRKAAISPEEMEGLKRINAYDIKLYGKKAPVRNGGGMGGGFKIVEITTFPASSLLCCLLKILNLLGTTHFGNTEHGNIIAHHPIHIFPGI